jgi:lipopolysaccharide/colanic/teichoic acid biosynthesis glycosyltransferase
MLKDNSVSKRLFDMVLAAIGVVMFSPILAVIAILIKLEDRASVFYRGLRIGRQGKPFRVYKFRTMVVNAEKIGGPSTSDDDPRITRIGKHLRKYKLDELPQLFNVLKGDMSFVGPRPEVKSEVDLYTPQERELLTVRPGITDYASIEFHDEGAILKGSADPHEAYRLLIRPRKIELGLQYVREHSLLTDLRILWLTGATLFMSRAVNASRAGAGTIRNS